MNFEAQPRSTPQLTGSFGFDPQLHEQLEEYAAAQSTERRGLRDRILEAHPHQASKLAEALDALEHLNAAAPAIRPAQAVLAQDALSDFRIVRELGRGGMGIVYEAGQLSLDRRVALKVLPFAAALDPRSLARFRQEALAAAQLDHPHIVRVYGVGCDRGVHYYAMQYIDGRSLAHVIAEMRAAEQGPPAARAQPQKETIAPGGANLSTERSSNRYAYYRAVARLGVQVAQALDYAHANGILHRDIKPGNLLLDARGNAWITDFGLARVENEANLTLTGDVLGTLRYTSPEQARARRGLVDQRTDIYSLGATLYELLSLEPAFPADDRGELLRQIAQDDPRRLRQIDRSIPREIETIVLKALEKDAADRYATALDLALDLQRFLDDEPLAARPARPIERVVKWSRRHRPLVTGLLVSLVLSLVGLTVVAALYGWNQRKIANDRAVLFREEAAHLHRKLLGESEALRNSRAPDYRRQVWANLRQVMAQDLPDRNLDEVRQQAIACLGDPFGLGRVPSENITRRPPPAVPERFGALLEELRAPVENAALKRVDLPAGDGGDVKPIHAVSHDGRFLAVAKDGVTVFDTDGKWRSAEAPLGPIHDLEFSSTGRFLGAACEEGAIVWSLPDLVTELAPRGDVVLSVAFHPTGQLVAMLSREKRVELWSLASRRPVHRLTADRQATQIEFSFDGNHLLALDGEHVLEAYSLTIAPEKRYFLGHTGAVTGVEFSPDGESVVSVSKDGTVRVWNTATGELRQKLARHHREIQDAAFSPDGTLLATGDWWGTINLWNVRTGERAARINAADVPGQIWRLRFDPRGRYLAAAGSHGLATWLIATPSASAGEVTVVPLRAVKQPQLHDLAIHPDGRGMALLDCSGRVYSWHLSDDGAVTLLPLSAEIHAPSLSFDSAGSLLTYVTPESRIGLWDWNRETTARSTARRFTETIQVRLARTPDGARVAVAAPANQILVYDLEADRELARLPPEAAEIWTLSWNSTGTRLVIGLSDGTVAIWDLEKVQSALRELQLDIPQMTGARPSATRPALQTPDDISPMIAARIRRERDELGKEADVAINSRQFLAIDHFSLRTAKMAGQWRACVNHLEDLQPQLASLLNDTGLRIESASPGVNAERIFRSAIATAQMKTPDSAPGSAIATQLARGYWGLGRSLVAEAKTAQALTAFRRAMAILESGGADTPPQSDLAEMQLAIAVDLGRALAADSRADEAERVLREAVHSWERAIGENSSADPGSRIHAAHWLSEFYTRTGQIAEAERELRCILRHRSGDAKAANDLAWLLANQLDSDQRKPDEAVALAQRAVEAVPSNGTYWNTLGAAQVRAGAWREAVESLKSARGLNGAREFAFDGFLLAMAEWKLDNAERAQKWYQASRHWMERFSPQNPELAGFLSETAALLESPDVDRTSPATADGDDRTHSLFSEILDADPHATWAILERARENQKQGRAAEAIADLRKVAASAEATPEHWQALAKGFQVMGLWGEAISARERLLKKSPENPQSLNELAWLLVACPDSDLRDPRRAVKLATRATEINLFEGAYWNTLGVAQYRLGNSEAARMALLNSVNRLQVNGFAQNGYFLALVAHQSRDRELAEKWYAASARWAARFAPSDEELARCGREAAQALQVPDSREPAGTRSAPADADPEIFTLISAVLPDKPWVLLERAECYLALGDRNRAAADLLAAVEVAGDDLLSRMRIIWIATRLSEWNASIRGARDLAANRPECWVLVSFRVRAFVELGQWESALDDLTEVAEILPEDNAVVVAQAIVNLAAGNSVAHAHFCRSLLERAVAAPLPQELPVLLETLLAVPVAEVDLGQIALLSERVAAADPEGSQIVGAARYRNGQFAAAIEAFDRRAPAASVRARDHFFLAMAHQRLEHAAEAETHLARGIERMTAAGRESLDGPDTVLAGWCDRITLEHLRREAESLVRKRARWRSDR